MAVRSLTHSGCSCGALLAVIPEPQWLSRARDFIGLHEIPGAMNEPKIVQLWRDAHMEYIHDDETAWCSAFVCAMLERSMINSTRKANARSFEHWGIDCNDLGTSEIPLGAILVFNRPPNPEQGHVGFAVGITPEGNLMVLGGNQSDKVSIATFKKGRLISARWPTEESANLGLLKSLPVLKSGPVSVRES